MEELAKKYVDILQEFEALENALEGKDIIQFCRLVAEELKRRGVSEERINNVLKGASWGTKNWEQMEQDIKKSPSILMGTWTKGYPKSVELDDEAQAKLAMVLRMEGQDPEEHRCKTCGAIYDDGQFCTYCGDFDPLDLGED